ncbi:MAG: hypothetical protein R3E42_16135 [Burkholderiaceae bacterium]
MNNECRPHLAALLLAAVNYVSYQGGGREGLEESASSCAAQRAILIAICGLAVLAAAGLADHRRLMIAGAEPGPPARRPARCAG